jgi:hypothetical protein
MTTVSGFRAGLAFVLATTSGCSGFSQTDLEDGVPAMDVSVTVDSAGYARNTAVIAEVTIQNIGDKPVSIPIPGRESVEFNQFHAESPEPLVVDFVAPPREPIEFTLVQPGETLTRRFLLPLAARKVGEFRLISLYRPELEGIEGSTPVASKAAAFAVTDPPAFDRDSNGVISEADAKRAAERYFAQRAKSVLAKYFLDEAEVGTWLVTVEFEKPDAKGRTQRSCRVSAYTGAVQRAKADETNVSQPQPQAGS